VSAPAEFLFDTSAFINGWNDHLPPATFPTVWKRLGEAIGTGRVLSVRAAYTELLKQSDDLVKWIKQYRSAFVDPSREVQEAAGTIEPLFPQGTIRNAADPWVIAEGKIRGLTVITYEGRSFSGIPHRNWHRSMPGICARFHVPCRTLPEAIGALGFTF
jgi:hypothetical protein